MSSLSVVLVGCGAPLRSKMNTTLAFSALSSLSSLVPNIPIACTSLNS